MFVFANVLPIPICFNTKILMWPLMIVQVVCVIVCVVLCCFMLKNNPNIRSNQQLIELTTKLENVTVDIDSMNATIFENGLQNFDDKINDIIQINMIESDVFKWWSGPLDNGDDFINNFESRMKTIQLTCVPMLDTTDFANFIGLVRAVMSKRGEVDRAMANFHSKIRTNLWTTITIIESEFDQNIEELNQHTDDVQKMFEEFIESSESVAKSSLVTENESSRISTKYKILAILSIFLSFLLLVALIGLLFISNTKTVFVIKSISFLVVLAIFTIAVLSITTIQSSSNNHKTSNSDETIKNLFSFEMPSSEPQINISSYNAFLSCQTSGTFFSPPNDFLFIQPKTSLHYLFEESDALVDAISINYDLSEYYESLKNAEPTRKKLQRQVSNACVLPEYKNEYDSFLSLLERCKNIDKYFDQLTGYLIKMREKIRELLQQKFSNIDDRWNDPAVPINEILRNGDFACNPLYRSLSASNETETNEKIILMLIFIFSSLSATIFSIVLIAKTKIRNDENGKKENTDPEVVAIVTKKDFEPGPIEKWVSLVSKANLEDLISIYVDQLQQYQAPLLTFSASDSNQNLNRNGYRCIDSTRVILKNSKPDYINASWIHIPNNDTRYILTQSPLNETIIHFWQMCCQENVKCIVMLCDDKEPNFIPYFPKRSGDKLKFGKYTIGCVRAKQHRIKCVTWRIFKIFEGDNKSKYQLINHVSLIGWSKNKIPKSSFDIIELNRWIKRLYPKISPICVHCDCGYGRSATFVGFDYALSRIDQNVKLCEIVKELRSMRNLAIENREQYGALYIWLLEYFSDEGIVDHLLIDEFMEKLKRDSVISVSIMAKTT